MIAHVIAQINDQCRDTPRVGRLTDLVADVRYATRIFSRAPGVAIAVKLGIGANAAAFSITDVLLLRSLPCPILNLNV